jgi:hypothetical protein
VCVCLCAVVGGGGACVRVYVCTCVCVCTRASVCRASARVSARVCVFADLKRTHVKHAGPRLGNHGRPQASSPAKAVEHKARAQVNLRAENESNVQARRMDHAVTHVLEAEQSIGSTRDQHKTFRREEYARTLLSFCQCCETQMNCGIQ